MNDIKIYTATPADLSPPVQSESFCVDLVLASDYRELEAKCAALAAENAVKQEFIKNCFRVAADGASMDSADILELGERLSLFRRETYQPVLHGYICGREAGEGAVCVMRAPATDAFLAEMRAQGVDGIAELYFTLAAHEANRNIADSWRESARFARAYGAQLRQGAAL
ncbi:TPA: hypothetical protein N3D36_001527 [Salmonella enterica subsp. enterica serovar Lehrte]|nr:hypothetical protein [Salmonella enterica subsp. enterica serovar Ank]EHY9927982.1 hypothetical protein [Salmonella enterica subsp. enterica serovar Ank]HCM2492407.1 hypothetical protein [Salmonella enterica subsp. enterica serovar Lehrte]